MNARTNDRQGVSGKWLMAAAAMLMLGNCSSSSEGGSPGAGAGGSSAKGGSNGTRSGGSNGSTSTGGSSGTGTGGSSTTPGTGGGAGGSAGAAGGSGGGGGMAGGDAGPAVDGSTAGSGGGGGNSAPVDPAMPGPTDLTKHRFSKVITLNTTASGANVMGDVVKYPVAVQLNAMNFDFAQAKPAGEDIRFALADGKLLPYAIEHWDAAAKQAAIWVKTDVKGNSNAQSIVMHWGNADAVSASSQKGVFSMEDGFIGVYHLNEDGSNEPGHYKDSSANGADLTGKNMEPGSSVAARIGKGTQLANPGGQGKNQWIGAEGPKINEPFNASAARPISATAWAYGNSFGGYYETIFSKGDTSWTLQRDYQGRMEACTWSGSYHSCAITRAPVVKQWVHYMVVQTTSNLALFVNGVRVASAGSFNRTGMHGFAISHNYQANHNEVTGRREWDGIIDEARVMTGARDANWAMLDFQSQKEGSTFLSFGATQMK